MLERLKWFIGAGNYNVQGAKNNSITRVAPLLNALTLFIIGITTLAFIGMWVSNAPSWINYAVLVAILVWAIIARLLLRRGYARLATIFLLSFIFIVLSLLAVVAGGITSPSYGILILVATFAGFMLGSRSALIYMGLFIVSTFGLYFAEVYQWLPPSIEQRPFDYILAHIGGVIVGTLFILYVMYHMNQSVAEVHRSEEQLRELFDLAPIGMTTFGLDGRFLQANQALCNTVGYSVEELKELTFQEITHPDDFDEKLPLNHKLIKGEISNYDIERRYIRKDGSVVTAFIQVSLIRDATGAPHQMLAQVVDLSERKQTEEALRQAQKLESLGILAGGIAHDFNNLLTSVLAHSSLVQSRLPEDSPALSNIGKIVSAAEQAASLTQQMLAYAGRGQFQIRPLNLNKVIRDNLHLLNVVVPKTVRFERNLADDLPMVNADVGQIQQMIMNLIINGAEAVEHHQSRAQSEEKTLSDGCVVMETDVVTIGDREQRFQPYSDDLLMPGEYVSTCVKDNGIGMDEETQSKIFDPFFSTKMSGRGLGLAAVLGIVRGHHGALQVESSPGEGTSFCVLLPVSEHASPFTTPTPPAVSPTALDGRTILVIDDEAAIRETVVELLESYGAQTVTSENGTAGIERYRHAMANIHLIILDLSMPGLSGEETFEQLRALNPEVPILVSSGYSESESLPTLMQDPYASFLQKPYKWHELIQTVEQLI